MSRRDDRYQDSRYRRGRYQDDYADGYEEEYSGDYNDGYDDDYDSYSRYDSYDGAGYDDGYEDGYEDYDHTYDGFVDDGYSDDGYDDHYDDHYRRRGAYRYDDGEDEEEDDYDEYSSSRSKRSSRDRRKTKSGSRSSRSSRKDSRSKKSSRRNEKDEKGRKIRRIILFAVELLILLAAIGAYYLVTRVEKVERTELPKAEIEENISEEVKIEVERGRMKGYRNIALFGVDSTKGKLTEDTRSDSIMILSINEETGECKLVSVYRDTYLNLSNGQYNKCNAAYAQGGPQQAVKMLNRNLDLNIMDYVTIGFGGLTDVINALGGVEISVEEDEISHLNNYQSTMAKELGMQYTEVTQTGLQTLDGLQATAYCRIRYTNGWDYKRAARQREVLYATVDKAKKATPAQLTEIASKVFEQVATSYELGDLINDVQKVATYSFAAEDTEQMQNGFPQLDLRIQANLGGSKGDCVIPRDLTDNVKWLHEFLFNDTDYQVSSEVSEYSDKIAADTAGAVHEEMTDADHT